MRKMLLGLLISLMIPISSLSKTIYPDTILTQQDYKKLALILTEHDKLKQENKLLVEKVNLYNEIFKSYVLTDSLYKSQISIYKKEFDEKSKKLNKLDKQLSIYRAISITTIAGWIIYLILK